MTAQSSHAKNAPGALSVFQFQESTQLRVVMINDEPWFVAADVCAALEVQNVTQAVARLDDDERSMFNIGRQGDTTVINESGLYSLILGSRKPEAKKFKKWVTSEVLPTIRKTGSYSVIPNSPPANETLTAQDQHNIKRIIWDMLGFYSNLTNAATIPMETAMSVPSLMTKRCSVWIRRASISRRKSSISRRKSLRVDCKSSLVTSSLRLTSSTSEMATASASACAGGTPAALSVLENFSVSNVSVVILPPGFWVSVAVIDIHRNRDYALPTAPHWAVGFERPNNSGAIAMRRPVHGFFYASRFMVGGVLGSRKARRLLSPLVQPGTSPTAICLNALVGGLKPYSGVCHE